MRPAQRLQLAGALLHPLRRHVRHGARRREGRGRLPVLRPPHADLSPVCREHPGEKSYVLNVGFFLTRPCIYSNITLVLLLIITLVILLEDLIDRDCSYLLKVLLLIAKKMITINWLKPHSPQYNVKDRQSKKGCYYIKNYSKITTETRKL